MRGKNELSSIYSSQVKPRGESSSAQLILFQSSLDNLILWGMYLETKFVILGSAEKKLGKTATVKL